jgi:rubrerythrin
MDYSVYPGGYPDNNNWARWVMDNIQGNIPDYSMPAPPTMREDPYNARTNLESALMTVKQATEGEAEDRAFYEYLISVAPSQEDRDIITGIRNDEMKHYKLFRQLYFDITGEKLPQVQAAPFEKPATYCEGLKKALLGEQNAVVKYRKILFAMRNRRHINMVTEIITDELRHLGLYNYLYSKNNCDA